MIAFEVNDMTCGHCASTITKALKATDPQARVTVDLARHLVTVEPEAADADELRDAIAEAGYTPVRADAMSAAANAADGGSCCGQCR
ncbi:heavy-metal-associated domain-containing protein [uncultured Piscinibacter sp.]|uniref:heavy-metal-associated domain-containing protein n=1 Tax=uncultured Piscinibacter sp. TaxID=1131835 RepID=UPI002631F558|nr:heavy-metal-associated domain-containing protein [uncultured Piscinibacter sp.]